MTAEEKICAAKTTKTAAKRFYEYICALSKESGQNPEKEVFLWSPRQCKEFGYGSNWAVCWEGGPYEWAIALSLGSHLYAGSDLSFGKVGPFPKGIDGPGWFSEPYNHFILCFVED